MLRTILRGAKVLTSLGQPGLRVEEYLLGQICPDGGFADISGKSDLYYTSFGFEALSALSPEKATGISGRLTDYLRTFGVGGQLDLVHLACLARCWAKVWNGQGVDEDLRSAIAARLGEFRCDDGGFSLFPDMPDGSSVYNCFLALCIIADLSMTNRPDDRIAEYVAKCIIPSGGYGNTVSDGVATTPTTAAAIAVLLSLGREADGSALDWLTEQGSDGAFFAVEGLPMGDLLSTATALHTLQLAGRNIDHIAEDSRRYVMSLLCDDGSFAATNYDSSGDCEYVFYALLALGSI